MPRVTAWEWSALPMTRSLAAPRGVENAQQLGVERAVRRDDLLAAAPAAPAAPVRHAPAGFAHDQPAGRHVPGLQLVLPVAVEAAGGDVAEVERGAAVAAQLARGLQHRPELRQVVVVLALVVGEAGGEERAVEDALARHPDRAAVAEGAAAGAR